MINKTDLIQSQQLPLVEKVFIAKTVIRQFYRKMNGQVYVSYSGGADSTALLHIVRSIYPEVLAVFSDTGLEYPEIKQFVHQTNNVRIIKPEMSFRQVIEKYGYPVISKEQALYIRQYRTTHSEYLKSVRWNGKNGRFKISEKWKFLVDAPFKISEQCCDVLKKKPLKKFKKESGLSPFIGNMASDSLVRERLFLRNGCNSFQSSGNTSTPLGIWTKNDTWEYLRLNNVSYCDIYDKGIDRTGCIFCLFGIHKEKNNRFEILKELHPKLYEYCMNDLGVGEVINFINSPPTLKR